MKVKSKPIPTPSVNKGYYYCLAFSLVIVLFNSCSPPEYLKPQELASFISQKKNGLTKTNVVGDYTLTVTYKPTDLWLLHELESTYADSTNLKL